MNSQQYGSMPNPSFDFLSLAINLRTTNSGDWLADVMFHGHRAYSHAYLTPDQKAQTKMNHINLVRGYTRQYSPPAAAISDVVSVLRRFCAIGAFRVVRSPHTPTTSASDDGDDDDEGVISFNLI